MSHENLRKKAAEVFDVDISGGQTEFEAGLEEARAREAFAAGPDASVEYLLGDPARSESQESTPEQTEES